MQVFTLELINVETGESRHVSWVADSLATARYEAHCAVPDGWRVA